MVYDIQEHSGRKARTSTFCTGGLPRSILVGQPGEEAGTLQREIWKLVEW